MEALDELESQLDGLEAASSAPSALSPGTGAASSLVPPRVAPCQSRHLTYKRAAPAFGTPPSSKKQKAGEPGVGPQTGSPQSESKPGPCP
eukprot:1481667-Pyramimonas_sp.AAC.1